MKECLKIEVTRPQLLELFNQYADLYISLEIMNYSTINLPLNDFMQDMIADTRIELLYIMLDFYVLLGKDFFKKYLCDKIKDSLSYIDDNSDELYERISYHVADVINDFYDDPDYFVDIFIDWCDDEITDDEFEPHFILKEE